MYKLEKIGHYTTAESLTLFWYKPHDIPLDAYYIIRLNDEKMARTRKTHCCVSGLQPNQDYSVVISLHSPEGQLLSEQNWGTVHTGAAKNRVDITHEPFCAVGDGETVNTFAIQKAIDSCGEKDVLYIPAGVFLTGALRLHSNMEVYLEDGAVLQGTSWPEDYLPRIWLICISIVIFSSLTRSCLNN